MTTSPPPHPSFRLPSLALPGARSSSPRTRSKSLSLARSPLIPTAPGIPFDHIPLSSVSKAPHARGASLHHSSPLSDDTDAVEELPGFAGKSRRKGSDASDESLESEMDLEEVATITSLSLADGAYDGPFQALDRREMLAVIISFTGVGLLALAAGLTTIYDWIL